MPMFQRSSNFMYDVLCGVHEFSSHEFRLCLTNTSPALASVGRQQLSEVSSTPTYQLGGDVCRLQVQRTGDGGAKILASEVLFRGSSPPVGPFRYGVLYNASVPGQNILGWWAYDDSITLNADDDFINDPDPDKGIYIFE